MWALIDNYDSFTHILHHYLLEEHDDVRIWRNDEISVEALSDLRPERIIISPGPQTPAEAGITNEVIGEFYKQIPILGICLGHQAIGIHLGGILKKANAPRHGKVSSIDILRPHPVFKELPGKFEVMRYHSLIITGWEDTSIIPLATTDEGELMAFAHNRYPVIGLQFHPESVLTQYGQQMIHNWAGMKF